MSDQLIRKLENANAWMEKLKKRNDELEAQESAGVEVTIDMQLGEELAAKWGLDDKGDHRRNVQHVFMRACRAINELEAENKWLEGRDLNATIELCYDNGVNPFARETLRCVDVSVSDNIYVVESKTVQGLQSQLAKQTANTVANVMCYLIDNYEGQSLHELKFMEIANEFLGNKQYNTALPSDQPEPDVEGCECGKQIKEVD